MSEQPKSVLELELADLLQMDGKLLLAIREELGLTPREMAEKLQCHHSTLNRYENDKLEVSLQTVRLVAKVLEEARESQRPVMLALNRVNRAPVPPRPAPPPSVTPPPAAPLPTASTPGWVSYVPAEPQAVPMPAVFLRLPTEWPPSSGNSPGTGSAAPSGSGTGVPSVPAVSPSSPPECESAREDVSAPPAKDTAKSVLHPGAADPHWGARVERLALAGFAALVLLPDAHPLVEPALAGRCDQEALHEAPRPEDSLRIAAWLAIRHGSPEAWLGGAIAEITPPLLPVYLPEKPFPFQKAAPCDPTRGELEFNNSCWWELNPKLPCPDLGFRHENRCLVPVPDQKPKKPPYANGPEGVSTAR